MGRVAAGRSGAAWGFNLTPEQAEALSHPLLSSPHFCCGCESEPDKREKTASRVSPLEARPL